MDMTVSGTKEAIMMVEAGANEVPEMEMLDAILFAHEEIKKIVHAPQGYELTCLLTSGYPAPDAFLPKQKAINPEERIHWNEW